MNQPDDDKFACAFMSSLLDENQLNDSLCRDDVCREEVRELRAMYDDESLYDGERYELLGQNLIGNSIATLLESAGYAITSPPSELGHEGSDFRVSRDSTKFEILIKWSFVGKNDVWLIKPKVVRPWVSKSKPTDRELMEHLLTLIQTSYLQQPHVTKFQWLTIAEFNAFYHCTGQFRT